MQGGLAQLMADLAEAQQTPGLPAPVQAAIVQILEFRTPLGAAPTANDVKEALTNSSLFLKADAAAGAQTSPRGTDIKTALLGLQRALKAWLPTGPATDPASARPAMPALSPIPVANPLPPNRGGLAGETTPPIAPRLAGAGITPGDLKDIAKTPPMESQISASSPLPASSQSIPKLQAVQAPVVLAAAAEVPSDEPLLAQSAPGALQSAPPPATSRTGAAQSTVQTNAALTPGTTSEPSPANAPPATNRATAPEAENLVPPRTPPLPTPVPSVATKTAAPSFVLWQGGNGPATAPKAGAAVPADREPESHAAANTAATITAAPNIAPQTDMKSALLVLQQVFKTALAAAPPPSYPPASAKNVAGESARPPTDNPPPPYRGAPTSAQRPLPSSLPAGADAQLAGEVLIKRTDAALAHMKLLQLASLPEAPESRSAHQAAGPRWMFEIPFATPQGTAVAQFQISRDGRSSADERTGPVWRARFSLDVEPIGPVHAQVALMGERAWITLWAEREAGVQSLRDKEPLLSKSLKDCEFAAEIAFCLGAPHRGAASAGQFLDSAS